jgi:hypothetical protein
MISSYLSLKNLQESLEVYIETFKDPDNHEDFGYKLCGQDFVLDLIGILDLLWPLVVLMLQPEHRVFTYATCPTPAVAKTPTLVTWHPDFGCHMELLNVGGVGKAVLFINALILMSCLSKTLA